MKKQNLSQIARSIVKGATFLVLGLAYFVQIDCTITSKNRQPVTVFIDETQPLSTAVQNFLIKLVEYTKGNVIFRPVLQRYVVDETKENPEFIASFTNLVPNLRSYRDADGLDEVDKIKQAAKSQKYAQQRKFEKDIFDAAQF